MRIPVDPLGALERATLSEPTDLPQTEAVTAARRIGTGLPTTQSPARPRMQNLPKAQGEVSNEVPPMEYQGEERRMGERRVRLNSSPLDTRVRADRRDKPARPRVDLKV